MNRTLQRDRIASDLMQTFYNPLLARAIAWLQTLPDGIEASNLTTRGAEFEDAAIIVTTSFAFKGLLVNKRIANFELVVGLASGVMTSMYGKLSPWIGAKNCSRISQSGRRGSSGWRFSPLNIMRKTACTGPDHGPAALRPL